MTIRGIRGWEVHTYVKPFPGLRLSLAKRIPRDDINL